MSHEEDDSELGRLLGDDVRRSDRSPLRPEPDPRPRVAPRRKAVHFEIHRSGERVQGRVPGTDVRTLRRLGRGEVPIDRELDLHGLDTIGAERELRRVLEAALDAGERGVRVIHGRGLRSEDGPVLKAALPEWLARPPHGPFVLGFTTADPALGGTGATCILLRRRRP